MPHRPPLSCPTPEFLDEVERAFSVVWPASFRWFCRTHAGSDLRAAYPSLHGAFLCDLAGLERVNVQVGEGSWGDYERAITGKERPKDGRQLYLELLPFYVEGDDVLGFLTRSAGDARKDRVVVWAVHTFVHEYPTFDDWLLREGGAAR